MQEPPVTLDPGLPGADARPFPGVENGFEAAYRVRFDEAGPDGVLRTSGLLRYAQDIAWRHSEALGFDRGWYASRGLGWVARGIELDVRAAVPLGHTLRLTTAVVGHRRIWARRMGTFRLAGGADAAAVTTDWVLIDGRGRLVRIPEDFGVAFTNPPIDSEIVRVAPPVAETFVIAETLRVRPQDLDAMRHVNNAVYVDWAEEALLSVGWEEAVTGLPRRCRIEYTASAEAGDEVRVAVHGDPESWQVVVSRIDGTALVRVEGSLG
jgi:acyl-CoA thioester hydrolase